jgi:hypothetical protein
MNNNIQKSISWDETEKVIHKEISWLKNVIDSVEKSGHLFAPEEIDKWSAYYYIYRLIAMPIVRGDIKAREINAKNNQDLWDGLTKSFNEPQKAKHGQEWHAKMMDVIEKYFADQGYEVITEPMLNNGRADLGVFMAGKKNLYVEVGTTSIYKLCVNLTTMKDSIFLIVPSDHKVIEFET